MQLEYRGYHGLVDRDANKGTWFGAVQIGARQFVTFEAEDQNEAFRRFCDVVNDQRLANGQATVCIYCDEGQANSFTGELCRHCNGTGLQDDDTDATLRIRAGDA